MKACNEASPTMYLVISTKLSLFLLLALVNVTVLVEAELLQNVTADVFGPDIKILPLAFGDFNSDKLTDMIVIDQSEKNKLTILLAQSQTFSLGMGLYFISHSDAKKNGLVCYLPGLDIVSAAPGDFDGDGGMDLMLVTREYKQEKLEALIVWGNHDHKSNEHSLICGKKDSEENWKKRYIKMDSQPLVIDGNGDNVADLYGSVNGSQGIWFFGRNRNEAPYFQILQQNVTSSFRNPHSNAFVDLNRNGNADLFLTTEFGFELWENVGSQSNSHFKKHISVPYPITMNDCSEVQLSDCIGHSVFADFDLDGRLDMVFPVCIDDCSNSTLYFATIDDLWNGLEQGFKVLPLDDLGKWKFDSAKRNYPSNIYQGLMPHVGDINLDGYPDLLIRLQDKESKNFKMQVLLNVKDFSSPSPYSRNFILQEEIMEGINSTVIATFYDLYENGREDIILVEQTGSKDFKIGAFVNLTQNSDAYFVKVIVLSGICYKDCPSDHIDVPYGTNLPGQTICYKTQRPNAQETTLEIESCAPQLPQTAHHALQLPYTIFGLGLAPNFLDFMSVNVSNASSTSEGKSWPQIIPNSQMYVIPHPSERPNKWQAKLFITPSRGITLTGLALVGTCLLCMLIILFFHWRERIQDKREKLQQPNQFHFDAM